MNKLYEQVVLTTTKPQEIKYFHIEPSEYRRGYLNKFIGEKKEPAPVSSDLEIHLIRLEIAALKSQLKDEKEKTKKWKSNYEMAIEAADSVGSADNVRRIERLRNKINGLEESVRLQKEHKEKIKELLEKLAGEIKIHKETKDNDYLYKAKNLIMEEFHSKYSN